MKKLKTSAFVLFFVFFMLASSAQFAVDKVNIKDVEYLKGADFVQLRFVTDKIISIPDVFYPDDNPKRLIMRISDVEFDVGKENFKFDSRVIAKVEFNKKNNYTDVEITLKQRVNYRVFTNRNGLYIEFPNVQRAQPRPQTLAPEQNPKPSENVNTNKGGRNIIKDIRVTERNPEKIRIEFLMAKEVEYNVIPIRDTPVRLAIDLKNTFSRKLLRAVNHLNVKTIRGARNSSDIFRLVFDLHYLKSYSVSLNKNILEVEFFNVTTTAKKSNRTLTNEDIERENPPVQHFNPPMQNIDPPEIKDQKDTENKITPPVNIDPPANIQTGKTPPAQAKGETGDFFSAEKSSVIESTPQNPGEQKVGDLESQTSMFQSKTINEGKPKWVGELRSYHLKDQDLVNLLIHFARDSDISMVFDPEITGTVTAELNDVPWDQALDIFLRQNDLGMQREGNVIRIAPITKLANEATKRQKLKDSLQAEAKLDTKTRVLNYAQAGDVKAILEKSLTTRGTIQIDARSNTLIITEVPDNFTVLDGLIRAIDTANPQVFIEARIIETNSNYSRNLGIQWGYNVFADSIHGNQTSMKFPNSIGVMGNQLDSQTLPANGPLGGYAVNLPATGATASTMFTLGNVANTFRLDMAISAMQRRGKGRIIQSPRFVTQNNVEATISQGYKIPVQTLTNNTIQVTYKDAILKLTVTPTITADDSVTMQINIVNDNVDWGNFVDKFPALLTQSAQTTVKAKNGETIVIGGMYKVETGSTKNTVPLLHKLPILGNLFKSTVKSTQTRETLIFITPRIVR